MSTHKKPENLILIYSNPNINTIVKDIPFFDKTFNVFDKENKNTNCGSKNCLECLNCYEINDKKVIVEKIKSHISNGKINRGV